MTLEKFKEVIKLITKEHERSGKLYELGIDIIDCADNYNKVIEILLEELFGEENTELIYWWLYENTEKIITLNDIKYDVTTIEDFHNYIENIG